MAKPVMGKLPWFRLYSRIIDDDKLRLLAFEDRWHFVAFCCLKSEGLTDEPDSELRSRKIAVKLGVQLRELDEVARRLKEVGLIDETLSPTAWDELQYRSDSSTDRVKKHRQKQGRNNVKRSGNVSVTAQETDKDTDTEEPNGSRPSGDGPSLRPEHVVEKWNEVASALGKPRVRDLTPERRQLVKARIAQYSIDDFVAVFGNIGASPFLRGDTGKNFCTFDWAMKKANFQKIIEGNYANG
ncbi:hypothetical protein [Sphingopyxis sp.]|uniref:hypothetical protein n=1 Tax=Sphingopyxis sp. TaxID=1908224 RepID=UPI0025EF05A6|nr:hypothetical protein [Sphingopyxis sp.]MBK6414090.1 hypothetical protein [Sphingopyxis sp.]